LNFFSSPTALLLSLLCRRASYVPALARRAFTFHAMRRVPYFPCYAAALLTFHAMRRVPYFPCYAAALLTFPAMPPRFLLSRPMPPRFLLSRPMPPRFLRSRPCPTRFYVPCYAPRALLSMLCRRASYVPAPARRAFTFHAMRTCLTFHAMRTCLTFHAVTPSLMGNCASHSRADAHPRARHALIAPSRTGATTVGWPISAANACAAQQRCLQRVSIGWLAAGNFHNRASRLSVDTAGSGG
jgi:hypothetical protein